MQDAWTSECYHSKYEVLLALREDFPECLPLLESHSFFNHLDYFFQRENQVKWFPFRPTDALGPEVPTTSRVGPCTGDYFPPVVKRMRATQEGRYPSPPSRWHQPPSDDDDDMEDVEPQSPPEESDIPPSQPNLSTQRVEKEYSTHPSARVRQQPREDPRTQDVKHFQPQQRPMEDPPDKWDRAQQQRDAEKGKGQGQGGRSSYAARLGVYTPYQDSRKGGKKGGPSPSDKGHKGGRSTAPDPRLSQYTPAEQPTSRPETEPMKED